MKKFVLIICLGFIFSNGMLSTTQHGKFQIKGTIDSSFDNQLAILSLRNDYQTIIHSDTSIISQGQFSFEGNEYLHNLSSITIEDKYGIKTHPELELLLESGTIYVSFSEDQLCVRGTPLNDIFMEYLDSMRYFRTEIVKIEPKWENEIVIFQDTELGHLYYAQGEYMMNFTKQNFMNSLGKALFISKLEIGVLPWDLYICENKKGLEEIFAFVDDEMRVHPRFISYMEKMEKAKATTSLNGSKIENFSLLVPKGKTKQLSEFIGKKDFVFLEFWASWCGPCLASIPKLKDIYTEHLNKLEIVSISLDTERASWVNAMKTQNMPWQQLVDLKGFDSDIAKTLGIKSIPFGLLLDKQGVVVAQIHTTLALKLFMQNNSDK